MRLSRREFFVGLFASIFAAKTARAVEIKGIDYITVPQLASLCGMKYAKLSADGRRQSVYGKYTRMDFEIHSRAMSLNGTTVWLCFPVAAKGRHLLVAKRDYVKTLAPILFPQKNEKIKNLFRVVIDAGHGGKDNGAMNKSLRLKEKAIALDVAFRLGRELKKNGYDVVYTRTTDSFVELPDRPKKANHHRANLFLSVHCNAAGAAVSGIETFALTPRWAPSTSSAKLTSADGKLYDGNSYDGWNELLAYYLQNGLSRATGAADRGVKRARFAVLRDLKMPGALIECGFITNSGEAKKLASAAYRQKLAEAIASGVYKYHKTLRSVNAKRASK